MPTRGGRDDKKIMVRAGAILPTVDLTDDPARHRA